MLKKLEVSACEQDKTLILGILSGDWCWVGCGKRWNHVRAEMYQVMYFRFYFCGPTVSFSVHVGVHGTLVYHLVRVATSPTSTRHLPWHCLWAPLCGAKQTVGPAFVVCE